MNTDAYIVIYSYAERPCDNENEHIPVIHKMNLKNNTKQKDGEKNTSCVITYT